MQATGKDGRNIRVMADTTEIRDKVQRAKAAIIAALEAEALRAGADIAALVENRIVDKGQKADGGTLSPYSTKPVPAFFYLGKSRNNAGENAVKKKAKQKQPISYRDFRQINGLNVGHKSLEFTGEMWQGFGPVSARTIRPGIVEVTIGGRNERTSSLLGYHSDREGTNITEPSREELRIITVGINERFKKIAEEIL